MPTTTFLVALDQLLDEVTALNIEEGALGYKFTANVGTTSLTTTDAEIVKLGANGPATRFQGWFGYASDNTEERPVGTLSVSAGTATITNLGANYTADTSSTFYLLRIPVAKIKAILNDALEYIPIECMVPLAHGPDDWHTQDSATTAWTASNCTIAKQTTAAQLMFGARNMSLTATADGGTATSTTVPIEQGGQVIAFAILKADTGTWTVRYMDQSSNTLSQDISVTEEDWIITRKVFSMATDDEGVILRFVGTTNNDQADVQAGWIIKTWSNHFKLPTWLDERFKLKAVSFAQLRQAGRGDDQYLAAALSYTSLREGADYRLSARYQDANPTWLEMINQCYISEPVFLTVECPASAPYGVSTIFTADSDTTTVPAHVLTAYGKMLLGRRYGADVAKWSKLEALGEREYKERWLARRTERPTLMRWQGAMGGVNI